MPLEKLVVLFMDCQTTGPKPEQADIIEIGWARSDDYCEDGEMVRADTRLVRLPSGRMLPPRVQKITGITDDELSVGFDPGEVWLQIQSTAEIIKGLNGMEKCPLVIHFAKFELPFLQGLHVNHGLCRDFPFLTLCTHEIARRLFPSLPRRSIRAMAGYFGYSLPRFRRCRGHIEATAWIWRAMVKVLGERYGVDTLSRLLQWLQDFGIITSAQTVYPMSASTRSNLPDEPGVYRMLRSNGDVLYVGKASSLRQRVSSYFRKGSRHPEHILEMLSQARKLDVTVARSALQAAILESDEIKRSSPPYNRALCRNDRKVWFCSSDFLEFEAVPTRSCRIGPVVCRECVSRLATISQLVRMEDAYSADDELLNTSTGIPDEYLPEGRIIASGLALFCRRYRRILEKGSAEHGLIEIGKQLWLQRQREKEMANGEPEDFQLESVRVPAWTAESVCHHIESNLARGAYEVRRARWFVLLCESSLCWEERRGELSQKFLAVFDSGQVLYLREMDAVDIPVPPRYGKKYRERQSNFDLMTFDRMRVVTTEIRKAVAEERMIRLRFNRHHFLDEKSLSGILKWI
ncbi:MAG: GIY-YIG nuclease family protein [candidate division WOR-3 bacterium]|nr:MAG: GIY-YIG nuclease family protein [candidate division WOR-3 bacterium]